MLPVGMGDTLPFFAALATMASVVIMSPAMDAFISISPNRSGLYPCDLVADSKGRPSVACGHVDCILETAHDPRWSS
jgi:hypothetical protein